MIILNHEKQTIASALLRTHWVFPAMLRAESKGPVWSDILLKSPLLTPIHRLACLLISNAPGRSSPLPEGLRAAVPSAWNVLSPVSYVACSLTELKYLLR